MAATMGGMHEGMQQVGAFFLDACVVGMVMGIQRLRMLRAAVAGFVQIADRGEYGIHQHRKHKQCQRGQAQHPDNTVAGE